jgi:hypothetical protein
MSDKIQKGYLFDGQVFSTMKELNDHKRLPQVKAALLKLADKNAELADWLLAKEDDILNTFGAGSVRRVTKAERKELAKALEHIADTLKDDNKAKFVVNNTQAILDTFKWPGQTRVKAEDKEAVVLAAFVELTDGNEDLAKWLAKSEDALEAAYSAGIVKREVSPETMAALATARDKRNAENAAKKAAAAK